MPHVQTNSADVYTSGLHAMIIITIFSISKNFTH